MLGQRGFAGKQTFPTTEQGSRVMAGGAGGSFIRVTSHKSTFAIRCRLRDAPFAFYSGNSTLALLFCLEDMTGSMFEVCLCLSLVLLLRLSGLRCPSPNQHLGVLSFTADPFLGLPTFTCVPARVSDPILICSGAFIRLHC